MVEESFPMYRVANFSSPARASVLAMGAQCDGSQKIGKEISRVNLFRYSNGRLFDELRPGARAPSHTLCFDVNSLFAIAASVGHKLPIIVVEKMEGVVSKTLILRNQDGWESR